MLKVLGSFRTTLALLGSLVFFFIMHPFFLPPSSVSSPPSGTTGQAVLALATDIPQSQEKAPSSSLSTSSSDYGNTHSAAYSTATAVVSNVETAASPIQPQQLPTTTPSLPLPAVQPVVTEPIKTITNKPLCVNTRLIGLKLDSCITI